MPGGWPPPTTTRGTDDGARRATGLSGAMHNGRRTALVLVALFGSAFLVRLLLAVVLLPNGGHRPALQVLTLREQQLHAHVLAPFYRPNPGSFSDCPPPY